MLLRHRRRPVYFTSLKLHLFRTTSNLPLRPATRFASNFVGTRYQRSQLSRTLESSSSNILTIVIVATLFVVGGSFYIQYQPNEKSNLQSPSITPDERIEAENLYAMPGAVPPGRPGNLTSEQEAKLKELWTAVLQVFGVTSSTNGGDGSKGLEEADQQARADTNGSEKPKKKRVSLFSKKHKNEDSDGAGTDSSTDLNDKWGQTKEFHNVLANQPPEDLRRAFWSMVKHDHPDGLLLRFLRARKWDVQNALIMMVATMHWRLQEMHVDDDIMKRGEGGALEDSQSSNAAVKKEGLDFLAQERLGKSFLHGTDREGRPMCFVRARLHKQGEQSELSLERYTVYVIETARLMLSPPVDTAVSSKYMQSNDQFLKKARPLSST